MHEELTQTRLKTGETLRVMVVQAPDPEHAGTVFSLLSHKGELRQWQFEQDFSGRAEGVRSRYYLGFLEGRAVANIAVWETGVIGDLGHVFTHPSQRRKGICRVVMGALMEDFRCRGGQLLVLGTGFESPAYHIYHSFGFRSMTPRSGSMRYVADESFFQRAFAPGPLTCGPVQWGDLGGVCALMACPDGDWVRSLRTGRFGPSCYETAFLDDVRATQQGDWQGQVARTETGVAGGYGVLSPDPAWNGQSWLLDLCVHPVLTECAAALLGAFRWPPARVRCYLDAGSHLEAPLAAAGFVREGCLRACVQRRDEPLDVVIMGRG